MNDQQFLERAHANPHDDSAEFLQALADKPQRQQLVAELKRFDDALQASLKTVTAPASLRQALLGIPERALVDDILANGSEANGAFVNGALVNGILVNGGVVTGDFRPESEKTASNDSFWRRNSAIAATLVFFVTVAALIFQQPVDPMEAMVFSHIYGEIDFLDDNSPVSLQDVNTLMVAWVGTDFKSSDEMKKLQINVSKDCWVDYANGVQGVHLVMNGEVGPVTVMVIPNTPLAEDVAIADERFVGIIHPTTGGNLVVVGEKEEPVQQFSNVLAANINW